MHLQYRPTLCHDIVILIFLLYSFPFHFPATLSSFVLGWCYFPSVGSEKQRHHTLFSVHALSVKTCMQDHAKRADGQKSTVAVYVVETDSCDADYESLTLPAASL